MPNLENLLKGDGIHKLTVEEQSAGGKASGKARAEKRDLRKVFEALLEKEFTDKSGKTATGAEVIAMEQMKKAMKGVARAFELVRDTSGQKPIEKVMIAEVDQSVIDEIEKAVFDDTK